MYTSIFMQISWAEQNSPCRLGIHLQILLTFVSDKNNDNMQTNEPSNYIYAPAVLDFVTAGVEFCAFLESENPLPRTEWIQKATKLLPMLYLKVQMLPEIDASDFSDEPIATYVQEEDYGRVLHQISTICDEDDIYLDVFLDNMKYSETPISTTLSENIADIYQDIRNFVSIYQYRQEELMPLALAEVVQNFRLYWGQKLVNVLRPLHALLVTDNDDNTETDDNSTWD